MLYVCSLLYFIDAVVDSVGWGSDVGILGLPLGVAWVSRSPLHSTLLLFYF